MSGTDTERKSDTKARMYLQHILELKRKFIESRRGPVKEKQLVNRIGKKYMSRARYKKGISRCSVGKDELTEKK